MPPDGRIAADRVSAGCKVSPLPQIYRVSMDSGDKGTGKSKVGPYLVTFSFSLSISLSGRASLGRELFPVNAIVSARNREKRSFRPRRPTRWSNNRHILLAPIGNGHGLATSS